MPIPLPPDYSWAAGTTPMSPTAAATWARLTGRSVPTSDGRVATPDGQIVAATGVNPPSPNTGIGQRIYNALAPPDWPAKGPGSGTAGPVDWGSTIKQGFNNLWNWPGVGPTATALGLPSLADLYRGLTSSGATTPQAVASTGTLPDVTVTARAPSPDAAAYRAQHGLTTDDLNRQSLAAAQAGRTDFNPALAALYGGGNIPGFNVVNALTMPPPVQLPPPLPPQAPAAPFQPNNLSYLAAQRQQAGLGGLY